MAFKRGKDPEQTLQLGKHRPYLKGDKLICVEDMAWDHISQTWEVRDNQGFIGNPINSVFNKYKMYTLDVYEENYLQFSISRYHWSLDDIKKWFKRV